MSTEMDLLRMIDPASGPMSDNGRDELLRNLRTEPAKPSRVGRRRLALLGTAISAVVAATGGLAVALTGQAPASALKINCSAGITQAEFDDTGGFTSVMDTVTDDAVADCADRYMAAGQQAPALQAYSTGNSYLWVVPSSWTVPQTWTALTADFRSDTGRLALKHKLDDRVDGPVAACRTDEQVRQLVQSYWAHLDLTGWTLERAPGWVASDGSKACAYGILTESGLPTVFVQSEPAAMHAERTVSDLVRQLRSSIAERCLSSTQAQAAAEAAVQRSGLNAAVTQRPAQPGRCATVDLVNVGETLRVVLS